MIIKSTGELVDVMDWNNDVSLKRSPNDWVSYVDSKGNYHFSEDNNLNIKLDFIPYNREEIIDDRV